MTRITKKQLVGVASLFAAACGRRYGHGIGEWHLSAWSPGDGMTRYRIEEVMNEAGGVRHPITDSAWLGAREAYASLHFVIRALEAAGVHRPVTRDDATGLWVPREEDAPCVA